MAFPLLCEHYMDTHRLNAFQFLSVSKEATEADIARAFRKRARLCHPDTSPGGVEVFLELQRAREILENDDLRERLGDLPLFRPSFLAQVRGYELSEALASHGELTVYA